MEIDKKNIQAQKVTNQKQTNKQKTIHTRGNTIAKQIFRQIVSETTKNTEYCFSHATLTSILSENP